MHGTFRKPTTSYRVRTHDGWKVQYSAPLITDDNRFDLSAIMRLAHARRAGRKAMVARGQAWAAETFAECLRWAWDRARMERATRFGPFVTFSSLTESARFIAEMSDDDSVRRRELAAIEAQAA